jgi:hypothetical protein
MDIEEDKDATTNCYNLINAGLEMVVFKKIKIKNNIMNKMNFNN